MNEWQDDEMPEMTGQEAVDYLLEHDPTFGAMFTEADRELIADGHDKHRDLNDQVAFEAICKRSMMRRKG